MAETEAMVSCPNGHRSRLSEVKVLVKSLKLGDYGTLECPVSTCKCSWCTCKTHGTYPCPPPCRMGPHD